MYAKPVRLVVVFSLVITALLLLSTTESAPEPARKDGPLTIKVEPWGPTSGEVDAAIARAENSPALRSFLNGTKHRQLE